MKRRDLGTAAVPAACGPEARGPNRRSALIALLGGAALTWPAAARAQQKAMPVVGFLNPATSPTAPGPFPYLAAFRQGLSETGYVEGQNVAVEYRWAEGDYDRLPALAADLVSRKVDVIATMGGTPAALAAKNATPTIPIIFLGVDDPVGRGLVSSLARPGSNLTGVTPFSDDLMPKRLELLSELAPHAGTIALMVNPANPLSAAFQIRIVQEAGRAKGLQARILNASTENEIDTAFLTLVQLQAGALVIGSDALFNNHRRQVVALASRHGVPAIYEMREFVTVGGLISYGTNNTDTFRLFGSYVGKILKGANPTDLPVQQPTKFELVLNLKTAQTLGLTVPQSILARADEVIE